MILEGRKGRKKASAVRYGTVGESKTRLCAIWRSMKHRVESPKSSTYEYYGGRGITVCKEWAESFQAFKAWAMANGYRDNLSIDRIDNNGNYQPDNCRWTTKKQQASNMRNNVLVKFAGIEKTLPQWAKETGIKYTTLRTRIVCLKWDVEKAFTTPPNPARATARTPKRTPRPDEWWRQPTNNR